MTVELALVLAIVNLAFAIVFGYAAMRRNQKTDDRKEQSDMTTVIVKLENIQTDTSEIKNDIKSLKSDVRHNSEDIIRMDESLKSAWRRINELAGKKGEQA